MATIINLIAAIILFIIPVREYQTVNRRIAEHPFKKGSWIYVNFELFFLVYSVVTAMVFLGPYSLLKYAFWIVFLVVLARNSLQIKGGAIVGSYLLFLIWSVISLLFISNSFIPALMMLIKYTLPLFYLWLAYTAIHDSDDLLYFMKIVAVGMCVYALIIGGFSAKILYPLYVFLNFSSGGLFISYASLADYFSGLIVIPLGIYLITGKRKWLYATFWVILSTLMETVRTGLGGLFLASTFFLITIYRGKAIPWIGGLFMAVVIIVFTVPSFREKMFTNDEITMSEFSVEDANFENIASNSREYLWDLNMARFFDPSPVTGSGLGAVSNYMKNTSDTKLEHVHSDYVQILCDLGLIGIGLFSLFVIVTIFSVIGTAWTHTCPFVLKLTGGMALGSCAGVFFSMAFDNVVAYSQQSFVLPFIMLGIYLKVRDLVKSGKWN